jgi:hypothetical protein
MYWHKRCLSTRLFGDVVNVLEFFEFQINTIILLTICTPDMSGIEMSGR